MWNTQVLRQQFYSSTTMSQSVKAMKSFNLSDGNNVSPWPWPSSLRPKSLVLALALALMHQVLGLDLECLVWLCIWHWPQVTNILCCSGEMVYDSSGNMYRHMIMTLLTYHLSSVSNLHLILGGSMASGTKSLALALALGAKSLSTSLAADGHNVHTNIQNLIRILPAPPT